MNNVIEFDNKYVFTPNAQPIVSLMGQKINKIFTGKEHVLALTEQKEVFCWGSNENSQLGIPTKMTEKKVEFTSFNYEVNEVITLQS